MADPYLYHDIPVLMNKLSLRDQKLLDEAEADYVVYRLKDLVLHPIPGNYDSIHLFNMHHLIFQDIYEWAGRPRTIQIYKEEDVLGGLSVEYSEPFDIVRDLDHVLAEMTMKPWEQMDQGLKAAEFCDSMSKLWKIHPFREGNTRTTVTFCCQYADDMGFHIKRKLFEDNARYLRTALVAYNAYFSDGSDFSKREYLERIVTDALN